MGLGDIGINLSDYGWVGIVIGVGLFFGWAYISSGRKIGGALREQNKEIKASTQQSKLVGKLRAMEEEVRASFDIGKDHFLMFFSEAYINDNHRDKVKAERERLKAFRSRSFRRSDKIRAAILEVYEGKMDDEKVNAFVDAMAKELMAEEYPN